MSLLYSTKIISVEYMCLYVEVFERQILQPINATATKGGGWKCNSASDIRTPMLSGGGRGAVTDSGLAAKLYIKTFE